MGDFKFLIPSGKVTSKIINHISLFRALPNNAARLRFAFTMCDDFKHFKTSESKDYERAETLKVRGNQLFQLQSNAQALSIYNEAITICPQEDLEGKKLYAILIANRSAVCFDEGEYQKVLQDVAFLQQYGHHPNPDKITARGTKALAALRKLKVIELEDDGTVKTSLCEELTWCSGNRNYPALSKKLTIKKNNSMGRHAVATGDIDIGEIVGIEQPYAAVVTDKANCDYCGRSTNHVYACPKCKTVYCSKKCLQTAWMYHQYECLIDVASIPGNFRLALRVITQRPLQQVIEEAVYSNQERKLDVYKTEDYYNVSQLIYHEDLAHIDDLTCSAVAVLLLTMLRSTDYFGSKSTSRDLSEEEVFVGELLLRYLQIIRCNSYMIFEAVKEQIGDKDISNMGIGIYPTLSLFNHSCVPSVTRYYIKNRLVLRSIKPIKAGDVVFVSYGWLFYNTAKEIRINMMAIYRFSCTCQACVENWPLMDDMTLNVWPGLCDCGGVIHIPLGNVFAGLCANCNRFKHFPKLKVLYSKVLKAESLYVAGNFKEAGKLFAQCIDIEFKYLKPPFADLVLNQIRLGSCFRRMANKI